jgi:hydrogenase maturation protein HypF
MATAETDPTAIVRLRIMVTGVVQGVGFRPFVHHLATEYGLSGFVGNDSAAVFIEAQGAAISLQSFIARLQTDAPPLAFIASINVATTEPTTLRSPGFHIVESKQGGRTRTLVPPDTAVCDDCLREMFDPADRRYRHPFITCTNCGPRFTIIRSLPYDRPATTLAKFPLCEGCRNDYEDSTDRRFHAQPIGCHDCGPTLRLELPTANAPMTADVIGRTQDLLLRGDIVAIKGIGGYHLACDATSNSAINTLRLRKHRPQKPFAIMVANLDQAQLLAVISDAEATLLRSPAHPIVLLRLRPDASIAPLVAPGNPRIGVMLSYSPIHHLLFAPLPHRDSSTPWALVMTSGNLTDEPICYQDEDARTRLGGIADAFLIHDREIHVPCDDSVMQIVNDEVLPLRRSRGYAPLPVDLGRDMAPVLATGGELKNTSCITNGRFAILSQHLGDMQSWETSQAFERSTAALLDLYGVAARAIATDAHPGYATHQWADRSAAGRQVVSVQHHHAHAVALLAEHGRLGDPMIAVTFDGTGYGTDGTIWGGEFLAVDSDPTMFTRAAHLKPVPIPGGDAAVRHPSRIALAYLHFSGIPWIPTLPPVLTTSENDLQILESMLVRGTSCVPNSSMGRLFDAVASLLGLCHHVTFEAQAAIELETAATRALNLGLGDIAYMPFAINDAAVIDVAPFLMWAVTQLDTGHPVDELALAFHHAVAESVVSGVRHCTKAFPGSLVGLTGGVFQNVLLLSICQDRLRSSGYEVLSHHVVPPNDGGLALGQATIAAFTLSNQDRISTKES